MFSEKPFSDSMTRALRVRFFQTENFRYQCMAHEIFFCSIENGSTKQTKQRGSCVDIALLFSTKLKQNLFRKQKSKGR